MRPLTLHVSALNNSEYDLYTASLNDLTADIADGTSKFASNTHLRDDAHYEQTSVGVREARAWLRGRFSDLPASDIDAILKFFCPHMASTDILTGGQFFAALRLVLHAKSGKGVDRALAFIQPSLGPATSQGVLRSRSPPRRPVQAPPSHPDRPKPHTHTTSSPETNPFTRRSTEHVMAPIPQADSDPTVGISQERFNKKVSQNPFLARDRPEQGADRSEQPAHVSSHGKLPPLPPRKPAVFAAPPRRPSETTQTSITSTCGPPLVPVKPTHVMSPLMRQSFEASKHAQSLKRVEERLDRERVLQVLKTTSSNSSMSDGSTNMRTRSLSPSKQFPKPSRAHNGTGSDDATCVPPLPRRRKPSLPSSTSSSVLSFEQVAGATLPSPMYTTPFRPPLPSRDVHAPGASTTDHTSLPGVPGPGPGPSPIPPPMHPRRRPSTPCTEPNVNDSQSSSSSSSRIARSKSVTAASSSIPPPPPRRKRPESMQLTPTSDTGGFPAFAHVPPSHAHARTASFQGLSRHLSLSRDRERESSDSSPMANIQKTLSNFQLKAQPKIDAVRYKAEAGISRRGYVHHAHLGGSRWRDEGEQGLMADTRWTPADVNRDTDSESATDDEPPLGRVHGAAPHRDSLKESDNLKWPMGEGWKPL